MRHLPRERATVAARIAALAAVATTAATLTACGGSSSNSNAGTAGSGSKASSPTALGGGQDIAGKKVLFIHANDSGNAFDKPATNGSEAAGALTGLKVDTQFGENDDAKLRSVFQSGIAEKVAGIVVSIPDASLDRPICAAVKAGIPVIAWNVNGTSGAGRACLMAYIGQDEVTRGTLLGNRMIQDKLIKSGDKVFCPVEYPNSVYAAQRAEGVNRALQSVGAKCDVVGVTADLAKARTTMVQYLLGHRDTNVIMALGGTPNSASVPAVQQSGLKNIQLAGFDLTQQIIDGIKAGKIHATVDQQPYSQGFFSVMQMAMYLKYGLFPSSMATGGTGLVDKSNINIVEPLVPDYR